MTKRWSWLVWLMLTLAGSGVLSYALPGGSQVKTPPTSLSKFYLPGETTHGHYQIELKCNACHEPFGGVKQSACFECHGADLKQSKDTHPEAKFRDPTKKPLLKKLDASSCITCHREHQPSQTHAMGVTVPDDYCVHCHENIAQTRPSHASLEFNTCNTAGCHNYHDNRALYENFLSRHAGEPALLDVPAIPLRSLQKQQADPAHAWTKALTIEQADGPKNIAGADNAIAEWAASAHAQVGVNCSHCHQPKTSDGQPAWSDRVKYSVCQSCHQQETAGFLESRHGMKLAAGLGAMTPSEARLPMHAGAAHRHLDCNACHPAHRDNTRFAAVDACLNCHNDSHSLAYRSSKHFRLWEAEGQGHAAAGTGVSCATCHLPRVVSESGDVRVQHNQSWNLRPNEKMVRSVCHQCHGLEFTLDALADRALIDRCLDGQSASHLQSVRMAVEWFESKKRHASNKTGPAAP